MIPLQLLRSPAYRLSPTFGSCAIPIGLNAVHLRKYLAVSVAVDEHSRSLNIQQSLDCLLRQGTRQDVSSNHDAVYFEIIQFVQYSLKRRKVGMNVVNGCNTHCAESVCVESVQA